MPRFLPVPWFRWQRYRIQGVVREHETGRPLAGLYVRAFDKDLVRDDFLGDAVTDAAGRFEIRFDDSRFKDLLESKPDIYLCVFAAEGGQPIHDTSYAVREDASHEEWFEIEIPLSELPRAS